MKFYLKSDAAKMGAGLAPVLPHLSQGLSNLSHGPGNGAFFTIQVKKMQKKSVRQCCRTDEI